MSEWLYDMDLWQAFENWMFDSQRIEMAPAEADSALYLMGLDNETCLEILDLCCGIGRHSIAFALMNQKVTGIDISPEYIERAKMAAVNADAKIDFRVGDVLKYDINKLFDIAVCMFTSFGFFEKDADNRQVMKNAYDSLKPGGKFFLDVMGKEIIARIFLPKDWEEVDGILRMHTREIIDDYRRIHNKQIVIRDGERFEYEFTHWLYSSGEIQMMLQDAGFSEIELYGDFDGRPYDNYANRLIAIATKKG